MKEKGGWMEEPKRRAEWETAHKEAMSGDQRKRMKLGETKEIEREYKEGGRE